MGPGRLFIILSLYKAIFISDDENLSINLEGNVKPNWRFFNVGL